MNYILVFMIGVLVGIIAIILRLQIKGNLAIHYIEGEEQPYMCIELDKDVESLIKDKIIILKICVRDNRNPQK